MKIKAFSLNEIGGRKNVEDAIMPGQYTPQSPALFIVCDGVGGSSFGEVASEIATKSFYATFEKAEIRNETDFRQLLEKGLKLFQTETAVFISNNPSASNTSTTLTLAVLQQGKAYVAWCGDSKIFQLRNGRPVFKSKDHSLVAELVMQGVITEQEAETHPQRNIITRSINVNTKATDIEHAVLQDIRQNDWLLLCTDGLMEQFTENRFPELLGEFAADVNYSEKIKQICEGKTKDNYSMYLLHIGQAGGKAKGKILLPLLLLIVAVAAGGWFAYDRFSAKEQPANTVENTAEKKDTVRSIMMVRPQEDSSGKKDSTHAAAGSDSITVNKTSPKK
ncbi:PP2C family protein-serine/threonine phosphatase [Sediminibacterium ginsengisoli]|uniref:Protein phosphatase n=1 Tax=Sediminibacterium ginsengisoli TaxID=413434 RepID=A0A1T4KNE8_9BACT|nr:protein phosphatase 2C domain-containing protein [Sediminibacterium ginsengisoli]SJZ43929.1 protein phosphatase [Sediminibacterium ginsengisoli]